VTSIRARQPGPSPGALLLQAPWAADSIRLSPALSAHGCALGCPLRCRRESHRSRTSSTLPRGAPPSTRFARGKPGTDLRHKALAALLTLVAGACGGAEALPPDARRTARQAPSPPKGPRDLLTLVPDGADLLVVVNLSEWRHFAKAPVWARATRHAARMLRRGLHAGKGAQGLLGRASTLVAAAWLSPGYAAQTLLLGRGRPGFARAVRLEIAGSTARTGGSAPSHPARPSPARPGRSGSGCSPTYRGIPLWCDGVAATALIDNRTALSGSLPWVRYSLDLLRDIPNRSSAREDRSLMALWRLVTGPKTGRTPVLAAVARLPEGARSRLARALHLERGPIRAALRVSLGRYITVRAFLDCPDRAAAEKLILSMRAATTRMARSRTGRALGLRRLLSLLMVHPEGARVVVQWIGRASLVARLAARVGSLLRADTRPSGDTTPRPRSTMDDR